MLAAMTDDRVPLGDRAELGAFGWLAARVAGRVAGTEPLALFRTIGKHRKLFRGWLRFAGRLMPGGTLARRETELVILRVAHLRDNAYESAHHERLSRRAGVRREELALVRQGPAAPGWTDRERVILAAVDLLHHEQDLDDVSWTALRAHVSENEAIELIFLVGHYEMLATYITTVRLKPDPKR
jgi:alkylhydroperoxidase family enzyme